ncbi:MAG: sugar phosphate isomerase/epimerase [Acidobacteria bacterium]|nr:sugar phosphate isomerase/epimerase [Acidobacteriota bacterium]
MNSSKPRRRFLKQSLAGTALAGAAGVSLFTANPSQEPKKKSRFQISLAEWSLHKAIQGNLIKTLDFPRIARRTFGIEAVELMNTLLEVPTSEYVARLKKNAQEEGVRILLIMCDAEGALAHKDKAQRMKAVQNHMKWVDIAAELGCHSIRVNMRGEERGAAGNAASVDDFISRSVDAFAALCQFAAKSQINIIVENHGGLSSNADVLARLMKAVNLPNFGTLPDFGNFDRGMDRYEGVRKLMPFAKGVSAKSRDFDAEGNETQIDYGRMMKMVLDEARFDGYIGIEYEGDKIGEYEGIWATKRLLGKFQ